MSEPLDPREGEALLALARAAIEHELSGSGALAAARSSIVLSPPLLSPRACFVTLKIPGKDGRLTLRGCIGSTEPRLPAHEAVVESAREAAFSDPRFDPLTRDELPRIVLSISVLTPFVPVASEAVIVAGRDGVVLACDGRQALFLPEVAVEQGWSVEQLLIQLARKAGLPGEAWRRARLSTFRTESFGEPGAETARIPRP